MSRTIVICHSEPGAWHPAWYSTSRCPPAKAAYTIGRTMFETDRLPAKWEERCNQMDEVWVPGNFHVGIFEKAGVDRSKIISIPEAVDVNFFNPSVLPMKLSGDENNFRFLSIFKWEKRKGWDILLKAYWEEFNHSDAVTLYILTKKYHSDITIERAIADYKKELNVSKSTAKIILLPENIPQSQMPSLYKSANAFVLPSRGEGWGRPHVEAMGNTLPFFI